MTIPEVTLFIATTELARCHRKKLLYFTLYSLATLALYKFIYLLTYNLLEHNPSRRKYIAFLHGGKPNNPL